MHLFAILHVDSLFGIDAFKIRLLGRKLHREERIAQLSASFHAEILE